MATTLDFDEKATAQVDAIYSTPDVAATRIAVLRAGNLRLGETALDVGCGPGYLLRDLALTAGKDGRAIGIDISEPMLALARLRCAGLANVRAEKADATALPVADGSGVVWQSRERERMRRILGAYDGHVAWPDLPHILPPKLHGHGFRLDRCEIVPMMTTNFHPNTYVFGLTDFIHASSPAKARSLKTTPMRGKANSRRSIASVRSFSR